MIAIGTTLSAKYRVVRLLGDGGMGSVYEAEHLRLGTKVAVKVLRADLAGHPGILERFLQEASVSAQIQSPHVVRVVDVEQATYAGVPVAYLVMELLEGEPLGRTLDREKRLSADVALEYVRQILQGLEAAHGLGVVHRDLKPDNVFVTYVAGRPLLKLIDFGIAKVSATRLRPPGAPELTVAGMIMGTAEYMAPEQVHEAAKVDGRADLYAVGVIGYELLAGARPVAGDALSILRKVESGDVRPLRELAPTIPKEVAGFIHRAMAARPEHRFHSAAEMRIALEALLAKGIVPAAGKADLAAPAHPPAVAAAQPLAAPVAAAQPLAAPVAAAQPLEAPVAAAQPLAAPAGGGPSAADGTLLGAPVGAVLAGADPKGTTLRAGPVPLPPPAFAPPTPGAGGSYGQLPPVTAERRKKPASWPWALGAIALGAALVGGGYAVLGAPSEAPPVPAATPTAAATAGAAPPGAASTPPPSDLGSLRGDGTRPAVGPAGAATPPAPRPSASARSDGGAPSAEPFPPMLPPFPSGLPTIPVPSAFPFPVPGFPPPPSPSPSSGY